MKKIILVLLLNSIVSNAQITNVNDTLAIENIGKKIEVENDFAKCEKWNNEILAICKIRMKMKNLHPKINTFYKNSFLTSTLTTAFFEEQRYNTKKAINIQLMVLKELEKEKNKNNKLLGYTYRLIGNSFSVEKEYEKSKFYIIKALSFAAKDIDKTNLGNLYNDLGFVYKKTNDIKSALFYYNKSLVHFKKFDNPDYIANSLHNLASIFQDKKEYEKAKSYYIEAISLNSKTKNFNQIALNYLNLSVLEDTLKNYNKSFFYLKKSYEFSHIGKNVKAQMLTSKSLYEYYKKNKNDAEALKYFEEYVKADGVLNKEENKNVILKAEFQYENTKKETQIKSLSQQKKIADLESERQKTIALILAIAIISILITSYVLFNRFKIKKQNELLKSQLIEAEKTIEAEKKATESELKALKSQMNPHFIFNALSSIQDQFMFGDKVIANEQMGNFTYLTRQILNVSGKKQILLSTEIDILTKYLELEKMRFKTDFEYSITTSETIDEDYHEIPPMLIQPFVENSIKHGLLHKNGFKKVTIDFDLHENEEYIICTITDNGIGRQKSAEIKAKNQNSHQSFSTESIEQRLELLNENLKLKNLITYSDIFENDLVVGTKVIVNIPIV